MKLLLDTHVFIWRMASSARLSPTANALIDDVAHELLVSSASAWEVATKHRLGKLSGGDAVVGGFAGAIRELRATPLPIEVEHALAAGAFRHEHRDPFDRMLAAQAVIEGAMLVTTDPAFAAFPVETVW